MLWFNVSLLFQMMFAQKNPYSPAFWLIWFRFRPPWTPTPRSLTLLRFRELIIDLRKPLFSPQNSTLSTENSTFPEEMFLFMPPGMGREAFKNCISMLEGYNRNGGSNVGAGGAPNQQVGYELHVFVKVSCVFYGAFLKLNYFNNGVNWDLIYPIAVFCEFNVIFPVILQTCITRSPADGCLHIFGGLTVYPGCDPRALCEEYRELNSGAIDC
jgi:hypothetical protein